VALHWRRMPAIDSRREVLDENENPQTYISPWVNRGVFINAHLFCYQYNWPRTFV
jgi:hypothetical protein